MVANIRGAVMRGVTIGANVNTAQFSWWDFEDTALSTIFADSGGYYPMTITGQSGFTAIDITTTGGINGRQYTYGGQQYYQDNSGAPIPPYPPADSEVYVPVSNNVAIAAQLSLNNSFTIGGWITLASLATLSSVFDDPTNNPTHTPISFELFQTPWDGNIEFIYNPTTSANNKLIGTFNYYDSDNNEQNIQFQAIPDDPDDYGTPIFCVFTFNVATKDVTFYYSLGGSINNQTGNAADFFSLETDTMAEVGTSFGDNFVNDVSFSLGNAAMNLDSMFMILGQSVSSADVTYLYNGGTGRTYAQASAYFGL